MESQLAWYCSLLRTMYCNVRNLWRGESRELQVDEGQELKAASTFVYFDMFYCQVTCWTRCLLQRQGKIDFMINVPRPCEKCNLASAVQFLRLCWLSFLFSLQIEKSVDTFLLVIFCLQEIRRMIFKHPWSKTHRRWRSTWCIDHVSHLYTRFGRTIDPGVELYQ